MARKSLIARERKRERMVAKYAEKRAQAQKDVEQALVALRDKGRASSRPAAPAPSPPADPAKRKRRRRKKKPSGDERTDNPLDKLLIIGD